MVSGDNPWLKYGPPVAGIVLTMVGGAMWWLLTLENRVSTIAERQQERGARITRLEELSKQLESEIVAVRSDPTPKPETKVGMQSLAADIDGVRKTHERLESRIDRIEDRLNSIHQFLTACGLNGSPQQRK